MLQPWSARALSGLAAGFLLIVSVVALGWHLEGGRWFDVATPSMGRAAPVGSLLLTKPTTIDRIRVGDVVTFHSPAGPIYTHRVVAKADRRLQTKGDINPVADTWRIPQRLVVGRVVAVVPGLGWILAALPMLLVGSGVVWLGSALQAPDLRALLRFVGIPVVLAAVMILLHPWVGVNRISMHQEHDRVAVRAVSTGVLPVALRGRGDHTVRASSRIVSGQVAEVVVRSDRPGTRIVIDARPSMSWLLWLVLALVCLGPLLMALLVGLPARQYVGEHAT